MRPAQQDADELYNSFSASIKDALSGPSIIPATQWDSLLGLEIETTITCEECPEEPPVVKLDKRDKIACNIRTQACSSSDSSTAVPKYRQTPSSNMPCEFPSAYSPAGSEIGWQVIASNLTAPQLCRRGVKATMASAPLHAGGKQDPRARVAPPSHHPLALRPLQSRR